MIRRAVVALIALVLFAAPASAQTAQDTLRIELVRTCGFAKAADTQLTKAVAADSITQDAQMAELIRSRGFIRGSITQCAKSLSILDRIMGTPDTTTPPPPPPPPPPLGNLTGTWNSPGSVVLDVVQSGTSLTGTVREPGEADASLSGSISGDVVTMRFRAETFTGTLAGDVITGTLVGDTGWRVAWRLTRQTPPAPPPPAPAIDSIRIAYLPVGAATGSWSDLTWDSITLGVGESAQGCAYGYQSGVLVTKSDAACPQPQTGGGALPVGGIGLAVIGVALWIRKRGARHQV